MTRFSGSPAVNRDGSVEDPKIVMVPRVAAPTGIDLIHASGAGALLSPAEKLSHGDFFTLSEYFYRTVGAIADPAAYTQSSCFSLSGSTEKDALYTSADYEVELLERHRLVLDVLQRPGTCNRPLRTRTQGQ